MSNEKLKIAVCLFGHLRSYQKCAPFLRCNLLKHYDCDLFMHTWSTLDHNTQTWHKLKKAEGNTNREDIIRSYGDIKGIKIEEQKPTDLGVIRINGDHTDKEIKMSLFGMGAVLHSMRESMRQCEEYTAENKVKYDYILFVRPDIWLKKPLRIDKILKGMSPKKITNGFFTFANPMGQLPTAGFKSMGGVDLLFFATPKTMSDVIKNNALAIKDLNPNMLLDYCPEYSFIQFVEKRGFTPYRIEGFRLPQDWDILRIMKSVKFRKRFIQLRICRNKFLLWIVPYMMHRIMSVQINIFGAFTIDFAIGNSGHGINNN